MPLRKGANYLKQQKTHLLWSAQTQLGNKYRLIYTSEQFVILLLFSSSLWSKGGISEVGLFPLFATEAFTA
ncbi:MAG: hypothetical protein ACJASL_003198 [Paraglaciecola sp.]|jgi:hypothetical protein